MKKLLCLFSAIATVAILIGCGTQPMGTAGTVSVSSATATGTEKPVTVTVKDADLVGATVAVTVTSTTDPVGVTLTLRGETGVYSGNLYFTTTTSVNDSTIRVEDFALVTITYKDAFPAGLRTATITWNASTENVGLDTTLYQGIVKPMVITVTDLNVSAPTVDVQVVSPSCNPIIVTLSPLPGQYGTYSGSVHFTLSNINQKNVVPVKSGDTVTVTYADQVLPGVVATATALWKAYPVSISVDSASYHGTQSKMTITVNDQNITASSVTVSVKSKKDTTGISVTLTGQNYSFSGMVGFSGGASSAAAIGVKDSDTVTVSIVDIANQTAAATANFYSALLPAFGIFSSTATPGATQNPPGLLTNLFTWSGTCTVDSAPNFTGTGNAVRITAGTVGWAGFGWAQVNAAGALASLNMTAYAACSLHVRLKGNASGIDILVENLDKKGQTSTGQQTFLPTAPYGYLPDEQWHEIVIPLSAWAATCDLSDVDYFMGATFDPYVAGQYIIVDDLYWTLPK